MNEPLARVASARSVAAHLCGSTALALSVGVALVAAVHAPGMALVTSTSPTASPSVATTATATTTPTPPAALSVGRHVLARIDGTDFQSTYLPVGARLTGAATSQIFRVRFQLHNAGTVPVTAIPRLEYRPVGGDAYVVVPEKAEPGTAFRVSRERVPGPRSSSKRGALGANIAVSDLRLGGAAGDRAVVGFRSMGSNPGPPISLPGGSFTEQEFSVVLTADAQLRTGYELRVTDAGLPLAGPATAKVAVGAAAASAAGVTSAKAPAGAAASSPSAVRYSLAGVASSAAGTSDVHGPYSLTTDQCATCHRTHTADAPNLLKKGEPQSTLCFTCHDGTGASSLNVKGQYAAIPANTTTGGTRDFYSHDVQAPSTHTRSELDEFGGVSNRHSECADCHNPHDASSTTISAPTATGWTASTRIASTTGVSVANGAPGTYPTYAFVGGKDKPLTREYQLCFKCHSGFTTLPSNDGFAPSSYLLDKAIEFNPSNASFHPIEAPGTNKTDAMTNSLAASGFTTASTIRCSNCHAGAGSAIPGTPLAAGGDLAPHASKFQGILVQNYRGRVLKSAGEGYDAADFALCLSCHDGAPFAADGTNPATNFGLHGKHLTTLAQQGQGGTSIDKPGDGQGNAICAECHFRLHSTTFQVPGQTIDGSRLVSFAPDVQPDAGDLSWSPGAPGRSSCTLTCHGFSHKGLTY